MKVAARFIRMSLFGVLVSSLSCTPELGKPALLPAPLLVAPQPLGDEVDQSRPQTIVLVAIDGVRWQDVFDGVEGSRAEAQGFRAEEVLSADELLPNLHALAAQGVALGADGTGIAASGPNFVSLPGYLEMLSGKASGCMNNGCAAISRRTVVGELAARPGDVAVISSWDVIGRAVGPADSAIVSTGRTHGWNIDELGFDAVGRDLVREGRSAGPAPGSGDFRRDTVTATIALHYLMKKRPSFVFLSLGETDELAHKNDYRGYLEALVVADRVVGEVASVLAAYEAEGRRTTLLVTTDHGRGADFAGHGAYAPESAEVWLIAAGYGIRRDGDVSNVTLVSAG